MKRKIITGFFILALLFILPVYGKESEKVKVLIIPKFEIGEMSGDFFPDEEWALRAPQVLKGTAVTADSYWKGEEDHANADFIADFYDCPDEYAVTEMEEIAIMNTAECFGLKDRVISLRVLVNMDTFLKGESAESLWLGESYFDSKVTEDNSETVDIFEPGMENLFDTGKIIIDAVLAGEL